MNILLAPLYALFSKSFYRQVIRWRLTQGFLYLCYLSALATLVMSFWFVRRALPQVNEFVQWAKAEMPPLTWTPEGLTMNAQSPYTMVHSEWGSLVTFDMTKVDISPDAMADVVLFVTSKKLFVKQGVNQVRAYDLTRNAPPRAGQAAPFAFNITPESLQGFFDSLKPWFILLWILIFFAFFFAWKLLAALFYSWLGLLINFLRRPKLNYGAIFNVSVFALTAATVIQGLQAFIPFLNRIPFGIGGSVLVTGIYLFLAIKMTEKASSEKGPSA
jgi:hypothetical protein